MSNAKTVKIPADRLKVIINTMELSRSIVKSPKWGMALGWDPAFTPILDGVIQDLKDRAVSQGGNA